MSFGQYEPLRRSIGKVPILIRTLIGGLAVLGNTDTALAQRVVADFDGGGSRQADTVSGSVLFGKLWGFGRNTTGGLNGRVYVVTRTDDDASVEGTLRYGVQTLTGPTWIVFDPVVFPPTTKTTITLTSSLSINERDDITIDGRGSYVSLERNLEDEGKARCGGDDNVVYIRSSRNIIMTHLDFSRVYPDEIIGDPLLKEACGDILSIDNRPDMVHTKYFDRIWINQSDFRDCGDECIGITHLSYVQKAYITVSRTRFVGVYSPHEKGMLVGKDSEFPEPDAGYGVALTLYRNRFYNLRSRLPRLAHGYLRAYNNVFENWDSYGILASVDTRVMIEQNVFRSTSSSRKDDAWQRSGTNNSVWARNNLWWTYSSLSLCPSPPGGSGTGSCNTSSFPGCSSQGGPWYYDCSDVVFSITGWSYADALGYLRSLAGWRADSNDVRDP